MPTASPAALSRGLTFSVPTPCLGTPSGGMFGLRKNGSHRISTSCWVWPRAVSRFRFCRRVRAGVSQWQRE
eukprot:scaffold613_cov79-Phaeocystis_antarctica.AAC.13